MQQRGFSVGSIEDICNNNWREKISESGVRKCPHASCHTSSLILGLDPTPNEVPGTSSCYVYVQTSGHRLFIFCSFSSEVVITTMARRTHLQWIKSQGYNSITQRHPPRHVLRVTIGRRQSSFKISACLAQNLLSLLFKISFAEGLGTFTSRNSKLNLSVRSKRAS